MMIDDIVVDKEARLTVNESATAERVGLRKVPERIDAL
jgi:hypothetical protein